jgi:hypothetical protein
MEIDFRGLHWTERAMRYRELAKDAFHRSQSACDVRQRTEYLFQASGWHALAVDAERGDVVSGSLSN